MNHRTLFVLSSLIFFTIGSKAQSADKGIDRQEVRKTIRDNMGEIKAIKFPASPKAICNIC